MASNKNWKKINLNIKNRHFILNSKLKTLRREWVETLEPPKVTHIITREMLSKSNIYGQITVRLHSKQVSLASLKMTLLRAMT